MLINLHLSFFEIKGTTAMRAIRVYTPGEPEVMKLEESAIRQPYADEVVVRNHAIGVNFTDVYTRNGAFSPLKRPFTPGKEAAGEVIAVGEKVTDFKVGDRVVFVETLGAYAEQSIVPEHFLIHLPDQISFETAAASMLKGLTAQYLLRRTFRVEAGHTILIHAAAGGVGTILTQWAKYLGATVIGTVSSDEKAAIAYQNGCDYVINYSKEDFAQRVNEITQGERCHVVYDSIGKDTFEKSLDCLRPFGYFVSFGFSSGKIPPFDIMTLLEKGSLFATWPGLTLYLDKREDVISMSNEFFEVIANGGVKIASPQKLSLSKVVEAHKRLEARQTIGATVLIP
ncbi:quinone oxidoreductase family protein [Acinetobacter courvalinii]|uniref:quinone oxidoreductase family protein n=1 Tax=Acinetobacter courvalinii TaxID=280147 RepID=UPI0021CD3E9F|nr:quinone oxidoreductase [Acinetobacter courvalinii]